MKQTDSCNTCIFNVMKNVADFLHFVLLLPFYVCYQNNLMYKFHKNSCMNSKPQQVARKTMLEPSVGQCVNPSVFFFFHCVKFHETLCVNIHIARNFVIRAFLMSWRMSLIVFSLPEILISSLWRVFSSSYFFYIFFFGVYFDPFKSKIYKNCVVDKDKSIDMQSCRKF